MRRVYRLSMNNLSDAEIKQLAVDFHHGKIFCDRHIANVYDIPMVFMILSLMDDKARKTFVADNPGLLYEYLEAAGPRSINGMPIFLSMRMLSQEDTDKLFKLVGKLRAAEKAVCENPV